MPKPLDPLFCYAPRYKQEENPGSWHAKIQAALTTQVLQGEQRTFVLPICRCWWRKHVG